MTMIKIVTIIGARPQIIKAAAISRAIANNFSDRIKEVIVHTGQHYDENMSQVFINELNIPSPHYNLGVGSGSHGQQTAKMIAGIEEILLNEKPHYLLVYGDTNSTLAGSIAASKIHVPVVHIEAGLRSFNKSMPEEINRIMCDHVSTLLFTPTLTGYRNLINEGFKENQEGKASIDNPMIFHCGDIMYDNSLYFSQIAEGRSNILEQIGINSGHYILATIHRDNNTDDSKRLSAIFSALQQITLQFGKDIVMPIHPRTSKLLSSNLSSELYNLVLSNKHIKIIQPVSFLEMIRLEKNAQLIITDSGGVQKEAYFFKKPCIIVRPETEWVEIIESGAGIIADADSTKITEATAYFMSNPSIDYKPVFGDGKAADFICGKLLI